MERPASSAPQPKHKTLGDVVIQGGEYLLWTSRAMVILAVVFCIFSAGALFLTGSVEIVSALHESMGGGEGHGTSGGTHASLLTCIIGAIDSYLIAMVLLIFSFGIYELFIGPIERARTSPTYHALLEIDTLDDLKNKVLKVIVMVLIVWFFQMVLDGNLAPGIEMLLGATSIAAICIGIYYLHKNSCSGPSS